MRRLALLTVVLMLLTGCGDDGEADAGAEDPSSSSEESDATDDSTAGSDSGEPAESESGGGDAPALSGDSGTVTVDGETMQGDIRRCEPFSFGGDEAHEDDISVVLFAGSNGLNVDLAYFDTIDTNAGGLFLGARLDLLYSENGTAAQFDGSATTDADGNWYLQTDEFVENPTPLPSVPVTVEGGRIAGGMTLTQSWPDGEDRVVDVAFDLAVPSEVDDC